jgi:hypothetical protein
MNRNLSLSIIAGVLICTIFTAPLSAVAADPCAADGIIVKNMTMLDLWYKKDNGDCFIWRRNHILRITSEDKIRIFSDLTCGTLYCKRNPTYGDYSFIDGDGHCAVRILPDCNLSDM